MEFPAKDYTIIIEHNHRDFVSSSNVHNTFELPAKVIFWADNVLGSIVDSYVGSLPHWIFVNKEHTFVFNIVMENSSTKVFEQRIFLTGNPNWKGLRDDFISSLYGAFLLWSIVLLIWTFLEWRRLGDILPIGDILRLSFLSTGLIMVSVISLEDIRAITFGLPYYYFGSGEKLWGDIVAWWGIWALTVLIPAYAFGYFQIKPSLTYTTYRKSLLELKNQNWVNVRDSRGSLLLSCWFLERLTRY